MELDNIINSPGGGGNTFPGFTSVLPGCSLVVSYNSFNNVWRGVHVNNFSSSWYAKYVINNAITVSQDPNNSGINPQYGVKIDKNVSTVVNSNTVTGFSPYAGTAFLSGVFSSMSTNCGVQCNSLTTLPADVQFYSTNSGMVWQRNTMSNSANGMQLNTNGAIGQQGTYSAPQDNQWQGSWTSTSFNLFTYNSYAVSSPIYRRTTGNYNPANNSGNSTPTSYAFGGLNLANNGAGSTSCLPTPPTHGQGWNPDKSHFSLQMAKHQLLYASNVDTTLEINDILLYRDLDQDTALRLSNDTLLQFYRTDSAGPIGVLCRIEQAFAKGDLSGAHSAISAFTPTTNIQTNYKSFYGIYYNYANASLSGGDFSTLSSLANLCPFLDGPVVYNARALNNLITGTVTLYADDGCAANGNSDLRMANMTKSKKATAFANYQLFPNPATNELNIIGSHETETVHVIIYDVNGKELLNKDLNLSGYTGNVKLNLINGIYFVNLITKNDEHLVKKLVIAK